jgi:signal transduction histidine kinase
LRGPLNSILGFAELLLEGIEGPINEIQAEDLAAIRQSAQNLFQLINNIVDLSKLNNDRLKLAFEPVNINQLVHNIVTGEFGSQQDKFVMILPETPPVIWGDSERVGQMLRGLITFIQNQKPHEQTTINVTCNDAQATIQVKTIGAWLTPKEIDLLFVPIVQIDETGRSELGIGGIKLPLIQQLAEKHNGLVWLESDETYGTSFYLKLPLHQKTQ